MHQRLIDARHRGQDGAAMLIVLTVVLIMTALGSTAALLASQNLTGTALDRQSAVAENLGEAGIAQAVAWVRANGVGSLSCSPTCNPSLGQPDWGQGPAAGASYGHLVTVSGSRSYRVWIELQQALLPPSVQVGRYAIHSTAVATSGSSPVTRTVSQDMRVTPFKFPIGVFAHTFLGKGNAGINHESIFSDSCITGRNKMTFAGTDAYYGVPAAAHSADAIVDKSNSACTGSNSIHASNPCVTGYTEQNDTDLYGAGLVSGSPCYGNGTLNGNLWLTTSKETSFASMAATYGFNVTSLGLSNSQYDALRTASQQQGFYTQTSNAIPSVLQPTDAHILYPHPVLFYDFKGSAVGQTVDLSYLGGYSRSSPLTSTDSGCTSYGAIVVVLNGNVKLNSNNVLVASVFAPGPYPNGVVDKANGTGSLIGTLYGDQINTAGTANVYLDSCFLANLPGGLLTVTVDNYRESDR